MPRRSSCSLRVRNGQLVSREHIARNEPAPRACAIWPRQFRGLAHGPPCRICPCLPPPDQLSQWARGGITYPTYLLTARQTILPALKETKLKMIHYLSTTFCPLFLLLVSISFSRNNKNVSLNTDCDRLSATYSYVCHGMIRLVSFMFCVFQASCGVHMVVQSFWTTRAILPSSKHI